MIFICSIIAKGFSDVDWRMIDLFGKVIREEHRILREFEGIMGIASRDISACEGDEIKAIIFFKFNPVAHWAPYQSCV